jgi:signal transduction histidine kinase
MAPRISQRWRVLSLFSLAVLPLAFLSFYVFWQTLREDEARIAEERARLARAVAFAAEAFIEGNLSTVRAVAAHPLVATARASPELAQYFARVAAQNPEWEGFGVVAPDGHMVLNTRGVKVFVGDRPYFRDAVASGRPVVSHAIVGRISGKTTIVLSVPFEALGGGRGVVPVPLPTDRFASALLARIDAPAASITLVDRAAQIFVGPDPATVKALVKASGEEVDAVLRGESGSRRLVRGGEDLLVAFAPMPTYGMGVLITQASASAFAPARRQAWLRGTVLAILLLAVLALAWTLGGRLAATYADLQRALSTRDDFLASASHDLRNPLGAIQGAGETLARSVELSGTVPAERLQACIAHIRSASRQMAKLLDGFLDVAQLQLGRPLELEKRRVDLAALLRATVEDARHAQTGHHFELRTPADLFAQADEARIQRAIGNLLANAVKYSPDGGTVRVTAEAAGEEVAISVEDRGIGVPLADQRRIFQRFQRGANAAGRFPGTGIGLSGASQIVEQHGGRITLKSAEGLGAVFTIYLPKGDA